MKNALQRKRVWIDMDQSPQQTPKSAPHGRKVILCVCVCTFCHRQESKLLLFFYPRETTSYVEVYLSTSNLPSLTGNSDFILSIGSVAELVESRVCVKFPWDIYIYIDRERKEIELKIERLNTWKTERLCRGGKPSNCEVFKLPWKKRRGGKMKYQIECNKTIYLFPFRIWKISLYNTNTSISTKTCMPVLCW